MSGLGTVVIVDETEDLFSAAFVSWMGRHGVSASRMRLQQLARMVSLKHDARGVSASPAVPLLLRPLKGLPTPATEEERFVAGEEFAAVWSFAALSPRPVINRPSAHGWAGLAAFSSMVTARRLQQADTPPEAIWHGTQPCQTFGVHQDTSSFVVQAQVDGQRFYRSRALPPLRGTELVVVARGQGHRVTSADLEGYDVEKRSVDLVRAADLRFATIAWGVPTDGSAPVFTRLNPYPNYYDCVPVLNEVMEALLNDLLQE
jgi:hypothetical protein